MKRINLSLSMSLIVVGIVLSMGRVMALENEVPLLPTVNEIVPMLPTVIVPMLPIVVNTSPLIPQTVVPLPSSGGSSGVLDTVPPIITIRDSQTVHISFGQSYTDAGATAVDDMSGDITAKIVTINTVNTQSVGPYKVIYTVTDTAGNSASEARTVFVDALVPTPISVSPILTPVYSVVTPQPVGESVGSGSFSATNKTVVALPVVSKVSVTVPAVTASSSTSNTSSGGSTHGSSGGGMVYPNPIMPVGGLKMFINNGASTTRSSQVRLTFVGARDAVRMAISNDPSFQGVSMESYVTQKIWTLTSGFGSRTVYVKFFNAIGVSTPVVSATIAVIPQTVTSVTVVGVPGTRLSVLVATTKAGQKGATIKELQKELQKARFLPVKFVVNGVYGPNTAAAVKAYKASLVKVNMKALIAKLRVGSTGAKVSQLQTELKKGGFLSKQFVVNGVYGKLTSAAVKKYQTRVS